MKPMQQLLLISGLLLSTVWSFELLAAETTREDIKKTLFSIKQKYQALADKEAKQSNQYVDSIQANPAVAAAVNSESSLDDTPVITQAKSTEYEGRFAVGEELILSMDIGSIPLGDVFAIKSKSGVKVGLSEFFQLVDFAIDVDVDNVSAQGWYIAQKNIFSMSATPENTLQVNLNNRQRTVPVSRFFVDDDIYVELDDIADWFAVTTKFDEAQLSINLTTKKPFPIENQLQRRQKQVASRGGSTESVLPVKDSDYQLFSVPLLDMQLSTRTTSEDTAGSYSILSSQDAAYFSSQLFLHGNDGDSLTDARLTLSRQSKKQDLLGPLKMTEYAFGDVTPVNIGVGNTQGLGRGLSMTNRTNKLVDNRQVNLVGEVQLGWDVELYRNGILIDSRINVDSGRYEFNDLELSFGSNDFELVFYGAQGQIERRTESHYVDRNVLDSGQGVVQFSAVDNNKSVLGVGDPEANPETEGVVVSSTYDYGLTDWLSVGLGATLFFPEEGENSEGYSLKSNLALGSYGLLNSVFQFDDDEKRSMLHSFRTRVSDVSLDLSYRQTEFLSDEFLQGDSVVRSDSESLFLRMSGSLFAGSNFPLNYENRWGRSESTNGTVNDRFENSLGMNTRWGSFSNGIVWQRNDSLVADDNSRISTYETDGTFAYRARIGGVFARVFSNYQIRPETELTSIGSTLNYSFNNDVNTEFRYTHNVESKNNRYGLQLNWREDSFTFSGRADYDDNNDWSLNLSVRFGLGYDTNTGTVFSSSRPLGGSGAVVVRMFEDENLDQQYTEGETVLDNVEVSAVQSYRKETTSEDGLAILKSLSTLRTTDIVVDESTFSDPSMMVSNAGFAVAARKGLVQQFDIPVVKGGELDGTIYLRDNEGVEDIAPYVRLSLIDADGEKIATTRSEYDGYYLFEKILPGTYQIQVDTSTGRQRGTTPERLKEVKISNRGDLIVDVDFVLRQLKSADGYIANVGEFSSLGLLKVYFKLLSERADSRLLENSFYIESKESNRYLLGAKYSEGQSEQAQKDVVKFCQELQSLDVDCKADNVAFEY